MLLRSALHARGLRFRLHDKRLDGSPDLVFPRFRTVVFVHGCFWHRHVGCKVANVPKSNVDFWREKFMTNVARDARNKAALEQKGWRVLISWECEINTVSKAATAAEELQVLLNERQMPRAP
jgi:DNA mismatch endonuclease (patch repair protein)